MAIQEVDSKIKQLESVEAYLVEQLSRTQRTQQKALENLHSVVQLCNKSITKDNSQYQSLVIAKSPSNMISKIPQITAPPVKEEGESVMITQQQF
jgi:hypothetical protein